MLSIQRRDPKEAHLECTPNLLPCRIHHDGPVNASRRYWAPEQDKDGNLEAYFRGRKLKGREVKLPDGYRGAVVKKGTKEDDDAQKKNAERLKMRQLEDEDVDDDDENNEEVQVMEEVADFKEFIIWGHEAVADRDDAFVKGVEEWIGFAAAMHAPGIEVQNEQKSGT